MPGPKSRFRSPPHVTDVARRFKCPMVRTKIGETNVTERMRAERAVMGGEGNGGVKVVLPDRRFHVRGSNTEPIVRVVAEGPSEAEVRRMVQNVFGRVAHIVNN